MVIYENLNRPCLLSRIITRLLTFALSSPMLPGMDKQRENGALLVAACIVAAIRHAVQIFVPMKGRGACQWSTCHASVFIDHNLDRAHMPKHVTAGNQTGFVRPDATSTDCFAA